MPARSVGQARKFGPHILPGCGLPGSPPVVGTKHPRTLEKCDQHLETALAEGLVGDVGIFRADRRGVLLISIAGHRQRRQVGIGDHLTVVVPGHRVMGDRHPHQPGYLIDHILRDI